MFTDKITNLLQIIDYKLNNKAFSPNIKLDELYLKWSEEKYPQLTFNGRKGYITAWNHIPDSMKKKKFLKLNRKNWQDVISQMQKQRLRHGAQKKFKGLCGQLYKFAIRNELSYNNFAPLLELSKREPRYEKTVFTATEIQTLYENKDKYPFIKNILILIFTGMRISEFLRLNPYNDIFLDDEKPYLIVRQSKTAAGTNRPIPIFEKILPFMEELVEGAQKNNREELLVHTYNGRELVYDYPAFARAFRSTLKKFNMKHTVHECRHSFASIMDEMNANDMAIRKIMGHAGIGVTKKVYTHKNTNSLFEAIELLDNNYLLSKEEIGIAEKEIMEAVKNNNDFILSEPLKEILVRNKEFKFLG